ncbi:MAG: hypothetical protein GX660_22740, partial [Clostridiaceae bacterium]|nr:hypothetical protein [Clostridiaceae bacterium]
MKNIKYYLITVLLFINLVSAQAIFSPKPLPDSLRQGIIAKLNSEDSYDVHEAVRQISVFYYDSTGGMNDILAAKIFKQDRSEIGYFIKALMGGRYGKPELISLLYKLIDSVYYMHKGIDDTPLIEHKYDFASILVKLGDYSRKDYIFQLIDNYISNGKAKKIPGNAIDNLSDIEDNFPEYRQQVTEYYKKLIRYGVFYKSQDFNVSLSLGKLIERNDPEIVDLCKYVIKNDTTKNRPTTEAFKYLQENRPTNFEEFLKDVLVNCNDNKYGLFKRDVMLLLIKYYSCPKNYKYITDYINSTSEEIVKERFTEIINNSSFAYPRINTLNESKYDESGIWRVYNDPRDTITFRTVNYLDSLYSYNRQCYEFGWISNNQSYERNKKAIEELKESWENGNKIEIFNLNHNQVDDFRIKLCEFMIKVDDDKNNGLITSEAHEFLYWYARWISGDCSKIAEEENPNLIKNPDMEDGTVDYWYTNNPYGGAVCTLKVNNNLPISGGYDALLNISVAGTANDRPLLIVYLKENKELGAVYTFSFKTKVTSGSPAIKYINYGDGLKPFGGTLSGEQEWTFTTTAANNSTDNIAIYIDGTRKSSFR